jgi:hypothetical protein
MYASVKQVGAATRKRPAPGGSERVNSRRAGHAISVAPSLAVQLGAFNQEEGTD